MAPRLVPTQFENVPRDMQPDDDERNDDVSLLDSYSSLRHCTVPLWTKPTPNSTGDDCYAMNKVECRLREAM